MNVFVAAGILTAAILVGCGPTGLQTAPPPNASEDTTLGPGDVFQVRVYGEADLSQDYRVAQDGTIDFPFIGRVEVARLEPTAVADLLETRLRTDQILVDPQVSLLVREYNSKRISVMGAVRNPGNYPLNPGLTTLQAVGLAGGTTDLANRDGALVTRRVNGSLRRYSVPLDRITFGASEDFRVRAGDIVFVPERPF